MKDSHYMAEILEAMAQMSDAKGADLGPFVLGLTLGLLLIDNAPEYAMGLSRLYVRTEAAVFDSEQREVLRKFMEMYPVAVTA